MSKNYFFAILIAGATLFVWAPTASAELQLNIIPDKVIINRDAGLSGTQIQAVLNLLRSFDVTPKEITRINDLLIRKKITFKPADASVLMRDLELGSQGEDVRALQKFLNNNGAAVATSGMGSYNNESIHFGAKTKQALMRFQQLVGLPATGIFDAETRALIVGH